MSSILSRCETRRPSMRALKEEQVGQCRCWSMPVLSSFDPCICAATLLRTTTRTKWDWLVCGTSRLATLTARRHEGGHNGAVWMLQTCSALCTRVHACGHKAAAPHAPPYQDPQLVNSRRRLGEIIKGRFRLPWTLIIQVGRAS